MMPIAAMRLRASTGGAPAMPYTFSNVKLLVHGSSRPFVDASESKHAVANMYARCTRSSSKIAFGNTGAGLFVHGDDSAWQFGTGSWFISAKIAANYGLPGRIFDTRPNSASSNGWAASVQATTRAPFITIEGTNYGVGTPAANLVVSSAGESTVSFSYDGTDLRCFVDGALSWSHTVSLNIDTGDALVIGNTQVLADANTTQTLRDLLIVSGESVAIASFTVPPAWTDTGIVLESWNPTTYSNVKLNCHMSGTNGGTTFTDTSAGAKTITVNGNAQTSTAQARIGSSSGLFDGTGDYLTVPDSADWDFGSGDYSVEMQVRTAATTRQVLIANYQDPATGWVMQISLTSAGRILFNETGDGPDWDSDPSGGAGYNPIATNTWVHAVVSRVSNVLRAFIEGECVFSVADSQSISGSSKPLHIGRLTDVSTAIDFNGYMQEVRVIKGEGYPRSFVVQTAPHPDS